MSEKLSSVTKTLSEREKISAIIWLIIGAIQVISMAGIIAGAWNLYCAYTRFKQSCIMNLRVTVSGKVKENDFPSRSESEPEEGVQVIGGRRETE